LTVERNRGNDGCRARLYGKHCYVNTRLVR
jgi:hypothetical protein